MDDGGLLGTLRHSIIFANALPGPATITLQAETYNLTLSGAGGDTQGDLDITRHLTIVGAGAGATVINAATLSPRDRIFEVVVGNSASLNLSRMTLTGGLNEAGGAIRVYNNTIASVKELLLTDVVIVGNAATVGAGLGGGVFVNVNAEAVLTRSVVTGNSASAPNGGGGIFADAAGSLFAKVRLDRTVVAKNTAPDAPDLRSDQVGVVKAEYFSLGGNLITNTSGANFNVDYNLQASDYVSSNVQYVVTSVVDSFDHGDDVSALSLREAIDSANLNDNVTERIWLPAWNYVLTRDRATFGFGTTDMNIAFGDLDISDTLIVRGSGLAGNTSVAWRPGVVDAVFDLLGDYNGDGITTEDNGDVSGGDFLTWQTQNGQSGSPNDFSADGDDDGDVDGDDLDVWEDHYGNIFFLTGVEV